MPVVGAAAGPESCLFWERRELLQVWHVCAPTEAQGEQRPAQLEKLPPHQDTTWSIAGLQGRSRRRRGDAPDDKPREAQPQLSRRGLLAKRNLVSMQAMVPTATRAFPCRAIMEAASPQTPPGCSRLPWLRYEPHVLTPLARIAQALRDQRRGVLCALAGQAGLQTAFGLADCSPRRGCGTWVAGWKGGLLGRERRLCDASKVGIEGVEGPLRRRRYGIGAMGTKSIFFCLPFSK